MAQVKYSRIDNRRPSSNYCSSITIAVFVAVCLLAVWFLTSSSVYPAENIDLSSKNNKNEVKDTTTSKPIQIEDNQDDTPDEPARGENDQNTQSETDNPKEETSDEQENPKEDEGKTGTDVKSDDVSEAEESGVKKKIEEDGKKEQSEQEVAEENKEQKNKEEKNSTDLLPAGAQSELLNETSITNSSWATQAAESKNEKEAQNISEPAAYKWKLCNTTAWADYIPCLDNLQALKHLKSTKHYEHRERHCPESAPTCLVPLPEGYKRPIQWPNSRDKIWYTNVPHTKLAEIKGHQNWVKVTGEFLTFPGGGTQFKHGALHYIEFIEQAWGEVGWGKRTRVVLDVGCGVASFGGYLFEKDVLAMSFAPKDEHEAQVQFALERGIPAISAVMGTKRLPFPGIVFDVVHCARCRVPWHIEDGKLLLELNRVLRPGGFFVWSATPVYQKLPEDVVIWKTMGEITKAMCWELVAVRKDTVNGVGAAIYRKPNSNDCYSTRSKTDPPLCPDLDDPNAAWAVPLKTCMHRIPSGGSDRGSKWPVDWPERLTSAPYWLTSSQVGVYGKPAPEDFNLDYAHWKRVVEKSYLNGVGIDWSSVRNVMDMRAIYGGFAAAMREMNVWVMNVVSVDSPDTLPIIYERGLFGIYHDWCESFSTYPRSYDLLHADHLFSRIKKKCNVVGLMAEVDRILRPEGKLIVRDNVDTVGEVERMVRSMKWEIRLTYSKEKEGLLCVQKTAWRPEEIETIVSSIAS